MSVPKLNTYYVEVKQTKEEYITVEVQATSTRLALLAAEDDGNWLSLNGGDEEILSNEVAGMVDVKFADEVDS